MAVSKKIGQVRSKTLICRTEAFVQLVGKFRQKEPHTSRHNMGSTAAGRLQASLAPLPSIGCPKCGSQHHAPPRDGAWALHGTCETILAHLPCLPSRSPSKCGSQHCAQPQLPATFRPIRSIPGSFYIVYLNTSSRSSQHFFFTSEPL